MKTSLRFRNPGLRPVPPQSFGDPEVASEVVSDALNAAAVPVVAAADGRAVPAAQHRVLSPVPSVRVVSGRLVRLRSQPESAQASVEYALVLLGAALVATLLIGWATKTQLLGDLFDHVLSLIRGKAQ